jgi:hypothetical protein
VSLIFATTSLESIFAAFSAFILQAVDCRSKEVCICVCRTFHDDKEELHQTASTPHFSS